MGNEVIVRVVAEDDTAAGAAAARANMARTGDGINTDMAAAGKKAGDSLGAGVTQGADGRLRDARGRFVTLGQDVDTTLTQAGTTAGDHLGAGVTMGADGRLRDARGRFVSFGRDLEDDLGKAGEKAGESLGSSLSGKLSGMLGDVGPQMWAMIAGGIVLGGPIISGALSGVVAGGVIAAAAVLQKDSPQIQGAWHGLTDGLKADATVASAGMVTPIANALDTIKANLEGEAPAFASMFTSAAQDVPILTHGLDELVDGALPGLQSMVASSKPIMQGLADVMGDVGEGVSEVASLVASNSGVIGQDLSGMGSDVKDLTQFFGELLVVGSNVFHDLQPLIMVVTKGLDLAADAGILLSNGLNFTKTAAQLGEMKASSMGAGQAAIGAADDSDQLSDAAQGVQASMSSAQLEVNSYGTSLQSLSQAYTQANAGAKFLEDSHDQATITAGQAIQSWQSLKQAVTSAGASEQQAAQGVASAGHAVQQASDGVASAKHSEAQATLAVGTANASYTESLYQQKQAQDAVTSAEKAAEQQLVSLKLQAESAATSALSAGDAVFQATQSASKLGVTPGNVRQIAGEKENSGNAAQIEAAIALLAAEDQLAQSQNAAVTSQSDLNTARQQGVAGNPAVLSAEHALSQANDGVKSAAQGVAAAEYAQRQAALQVTDAEYGLEQASQAVATARGQERSAEVALSTARDAASRSIDQNTLAGAKNRQSIEGIFEAYENATGSEKAAKTLTENIGGAMGFTKGKIDSVIGSLQGLDGTNAKFGITGTPTLNVTQLSQEAAAIGLPTNLEGGHVRITSHAAGGPSGGLAWVGEQGAELVSLPSGSTVYPHANSMHMLASGQAPIPRFAAGGSVGSLASPMSALSTNVAMASQWGVLDTIAQGLHVLGGPAVRLPAAGAVDLGGFAGFGGGSHVSGNRAANKAIMQQVFSSYGWGSGAAWAAQDYLEMREAGYDNFAQNPHSTAFGLGQFLNGTWASVGMSKTADPRLQSIGMAMYEGQRYGGPIGAAQHERAVNWYGYGGGANGLIGVGEHGPELLRVPNGSTVYPSANRQMMAAGGDTIAVTVVLDAGAGADGLMIGAIRQAIREGKINLRVVPGGKVVAG